MKREVHIEVRLLLIKSEISDTNNLQVSELGGKEKYYDVDMAVLKATGS